MSTKDTNKNTNSYLISILRTHSYIGIGARLRRGLTLVEVIVYIALLAIVLVFVSGAILSMVRAAAEVRISRMLNNSGIIALERMTRDIREADSVNFSASTLGADPGVLSVTATDSEENSTTTEFSLDASDTLIVSLNGGVGQALTASGVSVDSLVFYATSTPNSEVVKIEIELENRSGRTIRSKNFYSTVVLRGSYE